MIYQSKHFLPQINVMPDIILIGSVELGGIQNKRKLQTKMFSQQWDSNPILTRLPTYEATALSTYPNIYAFECVI